MKLCKQEPPEITVAILLIIMVVMRRKERRLDSRPTRIFRGLEVVENIGAISIGMYVTSAVIDLTENSALLNTILIGNLEI